MPGKLIVISAPSGCGKTTIVKRILNEFPNLYFSISATTREKRENETDGVEYFFISKDDFEKKIAENDFIEWNEHFGNKYGTLKSNIQSQIDAGKDIIFDLDVNGALNLKKYNSDSVLIFIKAPSMQTLRERLLKRGTESENTIQIRLKRAQEETEKSRFFDHIVINDILENAIDEIKNIINTLLK
jgi:guanylate kinase